MDGPCRIHLMPVAPHPVSPRGFNSCHHNCLAPQGCLTAHAHSVRPPSPIEWSISPHHRLPSGGLWGVRFVMLQPRLPSGAASQQLLCRYYNPVTSESRTSSRCASAMHLSEARKSVASSPSCTVSHRVHLEGTLSLCPLRWQAAVTNNLLKCRDRKGRLQFVQVIAGT
jgi:hypothetical protein